MKILIDVPVYEYGLQKLKQQPGLYIETIDPAEESRPVSDSLLRKTEVLFCTFPPSNLDDAESLRFIQIASAGYTQLIGLQLPQKGIRACNALGVFDCPIAEWCIAMMVNLARDFRGMVRNQESGTWDRNARFQREVRGLTVGIWGYGGIGRETARIAKAMGMQIHVLVRDGVKQRREVYMVEGTGDPDGLYPDKVFTLEEKFDFLGSIDFLVIAIPLTPANEGIIGEEELRALRKYAYLLNPARGPLVQEMALLKALREGWITGAAGHTLPISHAQGTSSLVLPKCHHDPSHIRVKLEPSLPRKNMGHFLYQYKTIPREQTASE
jgi:phosphoglycerate dehydrogenase-like enzyme